METANNGRSWISSSKGRLPQYKGRIAPSYCNYAANFLKAVSVIFCCIAPFPAAAGSATVTRIIVDKSDRTLWLMSGTTVLRTYRDIKLGDAPIGKKQFEGDEKTPEGTYTINGRNAGSRYHLSLRVSYPNAADRAAAARLGKSPGRDIFIHGQPNGSPLTRIPRDWTDGCIALSNSEIEQVWGLVKNGTQITIRP
jgi:murein L,D-transpeptidase YafK